MTMPTEPTNQTSPLPDESWEVDGAAMYRAASFAAALPAFMVGTALFMLGFSLRNPTVLHAACVLYGVAFSGLTSRILVGKRLWRKPLPYIVYIVAAGVVCYTILRIALLLL